MYPTSKVLVSPLHTSYWVVTRDEPLNIDDAWAKKIRRGHYSQAAFALGTLHFQFNGENED